MYFKNADLLLDNLKVLSHSCEVFDANTQELMDPFANLQRSVNCNIKIIKEVYGSSNSTVLPLYNIIFTESD